MKNSSQVVSYLSITQAMFNKVMSNSALLFIQIIRFVMPVALVQKFIPSKKKKEYYNYN